MEMSTPASSIRPETLLVLFRGIPENAKDADNNGILSRFNSDVCASVSKNPYSLAPDVDLQNTNRRLMSVLDSLASLCVSAATKEVYAITLETKAEQCTLYVACNGMPPVFLESYLKEIKYQILNLAVSFAVDLDKSIDVPPNDTTQDLVLELLLKCHRHGLQKIRRRLEKRKVRFDAYMAKVRQHARTVDKVLHDELCDLENGLNLVARMFKEQRPDIEIAKLIVWYASSLTKYLKDGSPERHLLDELDQTFATASSGFTMRRFFEKLFTHHTAVMNLVSLSGSVRFRPLIKSNLSIILVPGEHHAVSFPVRGPAVDATLTAFDKTALSRMHGNVETIAKEPWSGNQNNNFTFQYYVHAECALLAYLHCRKINTYPYVGVSKLACYSCSRYINAYNAAGEELDGSHERFFTRGTHGKIYLPWVSPELGMDQDKIVQEKMVEEIKQDMEALLGRDATHRAKADSTDISDSEKSSPTHNWASKLKEDVQEMFRGQQV